MSVLSETATANSLLGISSSNFLSRVKNMTNDEFTKVLGTINSESKRQAFLRRFGNTANTILRTRKNKVALLERKLQEQERKARLTKKVNLPTANKLAPTLFNTLTPAQKAERALLNKERRERLERAEPRAPAVVPPKRVTGVMTMANLERLGEKKIFVNLSYTPAEGIRNFSDETRGETTSEKQNVPVIVKEIKSRGYVFLVEVYNIKGKPLHLLLPSPIPLWKGGKIYTVPKSEATFVTDAERNPKKVAVQHAISQDDEALFGISYEANLYTDKRGIPFFYFLNQPEFKDGANDGIPMYDLPVVPNGFLMSGLDMDLTIPTKPPRVILS